MLLYITLLFFSFITLYQFEKKYFVYNYICKINYIYTLYEHGLLELKFVICALKK